MPLPFRSHLTDRDLQANADLIAAGLLAHPASLLISSTAVAALVRIAARDPPAASPPERRLLRGALDLLDAAEIAAGREARP
jgi:hypothetical protein